MSLPLIEQGNSWVGLFFCYIIIMAIYYSNTWNVSLLLLFSLYLLDFFFPPPLVSGLSDVVHLNFFCERVHLSSIGGI